MSFPAPPPPAAAASASAISITPPHHACEQEISLAQLKLYEMILGLANPMALRAAVLLDIPDIIAEASGSLTLQQIAAHISASNKSPPCIEYLSRILRFLASHQVFSETPHQDFKQYRYGLTALSKLLVKKTSKRGQQTSEHSDGEVLGSSLSCSVENYSYVPLLLSSTSENAFQGWLHLHESVLEGGCAVEKAFGISLWDYAMKNPKANETINEAMACDTSAVMASVVKTYEQGFEKINSLVDVGGGLGSAVSIIVQHNKHIRGINFDLPHVIASASPIAGVEHVSGNMFEHIPAANAVFMKWILHDWDDEDCVRVLKKCYQAIPYNGKVIIVDVLIIEEEKAENEKERCLRHVGLTFDIGMMVCTGGKERTEVEFKRLFNKAGFTNYTIFKLPFVQTIIEVSKT